MGAEQSREPALRKTETANFDFRFDQPFKKDNEESTQSNHTSTSINKKTGCREPNMKTGDYWLEVGLDVVKRLDTQQNTYQAFYSR